MRDVVTKYVIFIAFLELGVIRKLIARQILHLKAIVDSNETWYHSPLAVIYVTLAPI